jgi:hypothetical protein
LEVVVAVAELYGMLAAVHAAEVTQEHDHNRPLGPEVTEPVLRSVLVGK